MHTYIIDYKALICVGCPLAGGNKTSPLALDFRASDVAQGWRIPWYVLSDCYTITAVLLRDLFTSRRAESLFRVSGFKTSKDDPCLVARRVLATTYTTASPNSIVIGIDFKRSRMQFHQIERSGVSQMAKSLGAQLVNVWVMAATAEGRGFLEFIHPEDRACVENAIAESIRSGDPMDVECRILCRKDGWRWIRSRGAARRDASGNIIR